MYFGGLIFYVDKKSERILCFIVADHQVEATASF